MTPEYNGVFDETPESHSDDLAEAQLDDDVDGNGIFSSQANVHVGDGVFAAQYAIPGYLAREPGTGPSEVIDQQTGTPIASFTGGYRTGQQFLRSSQPRWPFPSGDPYRFDYPPLDGSYPPYGGDIAGQQTFEMPVEGARVIGTARRPAGQLALRSFRGAQAPVAGLGGVFDILDTAPTWQVVVGGLAFGALVALALDTLDVKF